MRELRHIQVLPDHVANQIAAGEVVERPASALKELLENAIDAGSTQVDAEAVSGGKTLVRVSDNGSGMGRDDALLSIERFATSKIRGVDEIERVTTLGFRGEALAAISSVSRFNLLTRRVEDLAGTELTVSGGKIQDVRDQGCALGTVISVRNLFFNVPARRKFIRSEQTELFHIRQTFMLYALSHPEIAMSLSIDGRKILSLPGQGGFEQRLRDLYPSAGGIDLRKVDFRSSLLGISGFVSLPTHTRADRSEQYVFVNGRPTGAAIMAYAIREAYRGLVARERHPYVFLFISIDPALVDVNVHPTKKEVRFNNPSGVRDATIEAIRMALPANPAMAPSAGREAQDDFGAGKSKPAPIAEDLFHGAGTGAAGGFSYPRPPVSPASVPAQPADRGYCPSPTTAPSATGGTPAAPWNWTRILGQVCGLYVVMETEDGLVLMDPHAAHERVLYEKFMAAAMTGMVHGHGLLLPENIELPPGDALFLKEHMAEFRKMGFGVNEFGGDTFMVDALPACLSGVAPGGLLADVIASLRESGGKAAAELLIEERIAQAACKAAVKAGKQLSLKDIETLIEELAKAEMPYTCPHGRPILINISRHELEKKFGRA